MCQTLPLDMLAPPTALGTALAGQAQPHQEGTLAQLEAHGTAGALAAALATVPNPRRPFGWRGDYPPSPLHGDGRHTSVEVSSVITSRPAEQADAAALLAVIRGHWDIEHTVHDVCDVTCGEDASQTRTAAAPHVRSAGTNLVRGVLRRTGVTNLAAALRTHAGRPHAAVRLLTTAGLE